MMDAKYLAEIKAREQAATPGPWPIDTNEPFSRQINGVFSDKQGRYVFYHDPDGENTVSKEDADFIAHARTDIPELIAEVERQNQQIATLKKALELSCRYHNFDDFGTVRAEMGFFIHQAQEQCKIAKCAESCEDCGFCEGQGQEGQK